MLPLCSPCLLRHCILFSGLESVLFPAFDPHLSPRNHVLVTVKPTNKLWQLSNYFLIIDLIVCPLKGRMLRQGAHTHTLHCLASAECVCVCLGMCTYPIYWYFRDGIIGITGIRSPSVYRYFYRYLPIRHPVSPP